ncbi:hypothetical protein [Mycolicibacterium sp. XJ1819]
MAEITTAPKDLPTTNALADQPVQGALIEAAFVRFTGTSAVALEDPPELDVPKTYIVKATCVKRMNELRKDNEERLTVVMEIDSCYERGKVPIVDENQGSLFGDSDESEDDEAEAEDES